MSKVTKNMRHLTNDEKSGIKRAFEFLDTDKDGFLDYHETKAAMRALGFDVKKSQVLAIMRAYDKAEGNKIGFEDFYYIKSIGGKILLANYDDVDFSCSVVHGVDFFGFIHCTIDINVPIIYTIVADKVAKRDHVDELRYAFKLFCGDSPSGKITLADLQRIDETLGLRLTEDEMRSMIEEFDLDQDGCSNF